MDLSKQRFLRDAEALCLIQGSQWTLHSHVDILGTHTTYLKACSTVTSSRPRLVDNASSGWESDDDVAPPPLEEAPPQLAFVEYYITFSDAFQIPEIYFRGQYTCDSKPILDPEEWNTVFASHQLDTKGLTVPTSRPIVGSGFCDALGMAMFSLHQCDTESLLRMCLQNSVRSITTLQMLLRLMGPLLGMPSTLIL